MVKSLEKEINDLKLKLHTQQVELELNRSEMQSIKLNMSRATYQYRVTTATMRE